MLGNRSRPAGEPATALTPSPRSATSGCIGLIGADLAAGFAVVVWGTGVFAGGLDGRETCRLTHHTTYDQAWRDRTGADATSFFLLANACNEQIGPVPAWVSPTIVVLAAFTVSALASVPFRIASCPVGQHLRAVP